jgi:hypothetical protein
MDNQPQFEPLFRSHAIERCGVTITFSEALPAKVFQRVFDQALTRFRNAGIEGVGPAPGGKGLAIQIDMASGSTTPLAGPRPATFATPDRATQFIIAPNSLTARTTNYVRWTPFAGQMEELDNESRPYRKTQRPVRLRPALPLPVLVMSSRPQAKSS